MKRLIVAVVASCLLPIGAAAQPLGVRPRFDTRVSRAAAQPRRQGDSLLNGILIGAGVGALAGVVAAPIAYPDCQECAGFNVPLTFGVIGAVAGAAIGAGLDAMRQSRRRHPVPDGPVTLVPVVGRRAWGLAGQIRLERRHRASPK